jgi:hypothetical protein
MLFGRRALSSIADQFSKIYAEPQCFILKQSPGCYNPTGIQTSFMKQQLPTRLRSKRLWENSVHRDQVALMEGKEATEIDPIQTFQLHNGHLLKVPKEKSRRGIHPCKVLIANQKNKDLALAQKLKIGVQEGVLMTADQVDWKDRTYAFLGATTGKLKNFKKKACKKHHSQISN